MRSGGYPKCIIVGDFLEGALREASGTLFFVILREFGVPGAAHLAPKRHQKQGSKKVTEKVKLGKCEPRGLGPFKH